MKVLVTFLVDEKVKKIGNEIIGKGNIMWYPNIAPADILLVRDNNFPYNENVKFIQTITAGVDHIDFSKISDKTVICSNAGAYSISVAEHAFALLLEGAKMICKKRSETSKGIFNPEQTILLYGKTLGILGYGGIGSRVAEIAKAFGMRVIAIGRSYRDQNADMFFTLDQIDKVLEASDFVLISLPLTKLTKELIGAAELSKLKKNSIMINVARAEIVKREALIEQLKKRPDFLYLTDVWWDEPNLKDTDYPNLVVTPHISGGRSGEVMEIAYKKAFENIKNFMENKEVKNIVRKEENVNITRESLGV